MGADSLSDQARRARRSTSLQTLARAGYAVSGLLHLLIGWIAVRIALGGAADQADQSGALAELAAAPGGRLLLWLGVIGFTALGLWQLIEAASGHRALDATKRAAARAKPAATALVHLALAVLTLQFARGSGSGSSSRERTTDLTAALLTSGPGRALLVGIGVAVVAVGGYHVVKGISQRFTDDLQSTGGGAVGGTVRRLGTTGYAAKGIALAVVGALFVVAAVTSDPRDASGLDGALRTLREQPAGTWLLLAVGAGLAAFGLYSFARVRYARM